MPKSRSGWRRIEPTSAGTAQKVARARIGVHQLDALLAQYRSVRFRAERLSGCSIEVTRLLWREYEWQRGGPWAVVPVTFELLTASRPDSKSAGNGSERIGSRCHESAAHTALCLVEKRVRFPAAPPEKAQVREIIPDLGLFSLPLGCAADVTVDEESKSTLTIYRPRRSARLLMPPGSS